MKKLKKHQNFVFLFLIFLLGLIIRFWWFPENVYFGYDQARDAIVSQEIYENRDMKIIGPSAGKEGLFHGPLYWYLIGPVYRLFKGNPAPVLGFISLLNALGIFLVYRLAETLFNRKVGVVAALLYAFSFSQSQYALYFANPAPAVLSIMLYFLGWALLIFKKKPWAWILIGWGLGLSVQFEFFLVYLAFSAIFFLLLFFGEIKKSFDFRFWLLGLLSLFLSLSSFVLAEFKFGFRTLNTLLAIVFGKTSSSGIKLATSSFWGRLGMEIYYDALSFFSKSREWLAIGFLALIFWALFRDKKYRKQFLFILIWIASNCFLDFLGPPQLYYVGIGLAIPVFLVFAFYLYKIFEKKKIAFVFLLVLFTVVNFNLIKKHNPQGPVTGLYVQKGMMLEDEKKVLDRIYSEAEGEEFAVNALTMPYKIKTTWAYLFNWYGKSKYGYVPYWGGEDVPGFAGVLPLPDSDQYIRFAIYEPQRGIPPELKKEFIDSENGFAMPTAQEEIGQFVIEKRIPQR